jgi:hypothetical protein
MALKITTAARNFPFCVIAEDASGLGAALPSDLTVRISAAPLDLAVISLDPNPLAVNNPFDPASGTRSVASGVANPGTKTGQTTVTAEFIDATGASVAKITDTVSVIDAGPGVPEWVGQLFGVAMPLSLPTAARASAAGAEQHDTKHHKGEK